MNDWTKPYLGITHKQVGRILMTCISYKSFIYAYAHDLGSLHPFTNIVEEDFAVDEMDKAKRYLERKLLLSR